MCLRRPGCGPLSTKQNRRLQAINCAFRPLHQKPGLPAVSKPQGKAEHIHASIYDIGAKPEREKLNAKKKKKTHPCPLWRTVAWQSKA